jgi:hypothetical protein
MVHHLGVIDTVQAIPVRVGYVLCAHVTTSNEVSVLVLSYRSVNILPLLDEMSTIRVLSSSRCT